MRKPILVAGLVVLAIACSEPVGEMLIDAGEMMRDGGVADASTMPDGSIGGGGTTGSGGMATGGTTGSGGMATGGTSGSGGGEVYSYLTPCDETSVVEHNVYSTERVDGETVRGQLRYTYKRTTYYSWAEVENVADVVVLSCDYGNGWSPAQPTTTNTVGLEYISNDPYPAADCSVGHFASYTGNRVLTTCLSVTAYDYNEANPDNDPDDWSDNDRVYTSGYGRVTITGTPVVE